MHSLNRVQNSDDEQLAQHIHGFTTGVLTMEQTRFTIDFDMATETIRTIKKTADFIIPGHGNYFMNSRKQSKD